MTRLRAKEEPGKEDPRRDPEKDPLDSFSELNSIRRFFFSFVLGLLFWSLVVWFTIHPKVP
jgi:hypothetical protein